MSGSKHRLSMAKDSLMSSVCLKMRFFLLSSLQSVCFVTGETELGWSRLHEAFVTLKFVSFFASAFILTFVCGDLLPDV